MCGPLVIAVNAARQRNSANSTARFFSAEVLRNFAYHGGRIVTYSLLGAISGLIGAAIVFAGFQRWISIAAGCLVLIASLTSFRARLGRRGRKICACSQDKVWPFVAQPNLGACCPAGWVERITALRIGLHRMRRRRRLGRSVGGVITMLAFGLGTAPMMLSVGLAGKVTRWGQPLGLPRVVMVCAAVAGTLLIVRGLSLGIPYLSPQYIDGAGPACPCHPTIRIIFNAFPCHLTAPFGCL
jgi:uncharacterized protein